MRTTDEDLGLSTSGLDRARAFVTDCVTQGKIAGAVTLVARHDRIAQQACIGMADIEAGKPMQPDTIFRIASMTKPIASVAALMLVEAGRLRLDDPLSRYIPELGTVKVFAGVEDGQIKLEALERPITIYDLLTHTSGLASDPPDPLFGPDYDVYDPGVSLAVTMRRLALRPLAHQPGRAWNYGFSHDVLGRVIEVVADAPLDDALEAMIFSPMGMSDTSFLVPPEKVERFAALYDVTDGGLRLSDAPATSRFTRRPVFLGGGGGLVSTVPDYFRFASMLLRRGELDGVRLLRPETVDLMTRNHLIDALYPMRWRGYVFGGAGYGLGVGVAVEPALMDAAGSEGTYDWDGNRNTQFWVDPIKQLIGIIMTQYEPFDMGGVKLEFRSLVYQALMD